jgi:glycosyltransferase involved in cell wall biosynthesis
LAGFSEEFQDFLVFEIQFLTAAYVALISALLEVAKILSDSSLFLLFVCPEDFGLLLAEFLVSGCPVVAYHGIGGR